VSAPNAGLPLRVAWASGLSGALGVAVVAVLFGEASGAGSAALVGALAGIAGAVSAAAAARRTHSALRRATRDARALGESSGSAVVPLGSVRALDETAGLARALAALRKKIAEGRARDERAREDAQEADRYKTDFLTAVSHELRTPLNAILGFADVLLRELDGPLTPGAREDVATIHTAGANLRALFEDVIDLSALNSSRVTLVREEVDVAPLLEETRRLLEGQRRDRPIELRVEVAENTPPVSADPKRLRQILTNLGTNALKFTERGSVTFEARGEGDEVVVVVRDTGAGITRGDLETLFTEYTQVGDVSRRTRGTGLGLAICKQLVELHGGSVRAESAFGQGSAFTVRLPTRAPKELT
jgi:signal transduction histidine kinase